MGERTTGATDAQIEAAHADYSEPPNYGVRYRLFDFQQIAQYLIPPDHRIIGPDDIAALRRVLHNEGDIYQRSQDWNRLTVLIGDDGNG